MPPVPDFSDPRVCAHVRHLGMTAMRQPSQTRAGTKSHTRQHEKCDSMITDCFPIQCPENAEACSSRMRLPLTSICPLSGCLAAITWEPCRSPPILLQCNAGLLSQPVCPLSAHPHHSRDVMTTSLNHPAATCTPPRPVPQSLPPSSGYTFPP
jgi:hypothetical protein